MSQEERSRINLAPNKRLEGDGKLRRVGVLVWIAAAGMRLDTNWTPELLATVAQKRCLLELAKRVKDEREIEIG